MRAALDGARLPKMGRGRTAQVLTYGLQNNDPAWVRDQYSLGVQGAIVDDVAGVISAFGRPQLASAHA
jgi:glycerophosphoryl diester phosphodiesterase